MADARGGVDFEGIGALRATFKIDDDTITFDRTKNNGSAQVGLAVTVVAAGTVGLAADGNPIKGKLILVEADDKAVVQIQGGMTLPAGDGVNTAALTLGWPIVGDLGPDSAKGYVRVANSAVAAEIAKGRGEILDAEDTANVVVML